MTINLLKWHLDVGADLAIEQKPVDNLAAKPEEQSIMPKQKQAPIIQQDEIKTGGRLMSIDEAVSESQRLAAGVKTLEELEAAVRGFDGMMIKKTANNTVFSEGAKNAKLMLVGEAPGANEDLEGRPFCGVSGKLLDEMFKAIGYSRAENLYITNTIFWRPPGNRRPTPDELKICKPFVEKHIELISPKLLVLVGSTASEALMGDKSSMSGQRGRFVKYLDRFSKREVPAVAIFHPSYLLRQPSQKKLAWQDLLKIKHFMEG